LKVYFAPNTRAVRTVWLLEELGLGYELERFRLGDKAMRAPDYLAINPNGRVPTLIDGAVRISESTAIAQYLVERHGNGRFRPEVSAPEYPAYLQWLHYGEGMIMAPIQNIVVETVFLPPERRNEENVARARKVLARVLAAVDSHMAGRDYLAGEFSAADTITGHACLMAESVGADLSGTPDLAAYVSRLRSRAAFQAAQNA
jgi:glutathione S-transferase